MNAPPPATARAKLPLFAGVTPYHWFVVGVASFAWLFDCMGGRIFVLARESAVHELLGGGVSDARMKFWSGWATSVMMIGWASGGLIFGPMSDRRGRVSTMIATLLAYAAFSGLSGLAHNCGEFLLYRFLGGLGIGGLFAAATTLVAESVPGQIRPLALGTMQTLSAIGNMFGSLLSRHIQPGQHDFLFGFSGWRWIFFASAAPVLLALPFAWLLREPESWLAARRQAAENADATRQIGSIAGLFKNPLLRRNTLVAITLGFAGMAGLWGLGYYSPELISTALQGEPQSVVDTVRAYGSTFQDMGGFLGMVCFTIAATCWGRRPAFLAALALCFGTTVFVFNCLRSGGNAYWMLPLMGFAQLSVFSGYSIYFPELFPTRVRGAGVGFCYNTVRYLAAGFPPLLMGLNATLGGHGVHEPFRKAATILSFVFLLGLAALIWAPETKGRPLPE